MTQKRSPVPGSVLALQREIVFIIFAEIQRLRFDRDPLAWIVLEFPAFFCLYHDTAFDAQDLVFSDRRPIRAVVT